MKKKQARKSHAPTEKNNIVSIADELVFEILTYIPVKSLLQFRSVCKSWRSMISDPSFVEAHQSRSATTLLISFPDTRRPSGRRHLFSISDGEARQLSGFPHWNNSQSVNGLICIYEQIDPSSPKLSFRVIVCNPSTGERVTLPPTHFSKAGFSFCHQNISLGFDPSTKTYKILRAWWGRFEGPIHEIFTLGSHAWRIIKDDPEYALETKGICLNGTIYWAAAFDLSVENSSFVVMKNRVIAFDVGEEKFRSVPVPPEAPIWEKYKSNVIQIGGHMAIASCPEVATGISTAMVVWKLEDSVNGVWSQKRILLPECWIHRPVPNPRFGRFFVASSDGGKIILIPSGFFRDFSLFQCNKEEGCLWREAIHRPPHDDWVSRSLSIVSARQVCEYVESLVSLKEICRL
ncbi:F-box protein At5g65850-like [Vitis riparia]|uniref:F-box protein At5g65850-like n=1 Tax=Vitis riparia TaxID=96939 RepID=UPI00155A169F|nr:F-box protein At5g65850-like [Vitis riparia]